MSIRSKAVALLAFGICASALGYELTDERAKAIVVADVLTERCGPVHPRGRDVFLHYRTSASKLLSVATVEPSAYARRYSELSQVVAGLPPSKLSTDCDEMLPRIEKMIPEMERDYEAYLDLMDADRRRDADAWRGALEMIASISNAFSRGSGFPTIPIPSGRVYSDPGRSSGSTHYLVNTPNGQRQCHVTSTKYIFCN